LAEALLPWTRTAPPAGHSATLVVEGSLSAAEVLPPPKQAVQTQPAPATVVPPPATATHPVPAALTQSPAPHVRRTLPRPPPPSRPLSGFFAGARLFLVFALAVLLAWVLFRPQGEKSGDNKGALPESIRPPD